MFETLLKCSREVEYVRSFMDFIGALTRYT